MQQHILMKLHQAYGYTSDVAYTWESLVITEITSSTVVDCRMSLGARRRPCAECRACLPTVSTDYR